MKDILKSVLSLSQKDKDEVMYRLMFGKGWKFCPTCGTALPVMPTIHRCSMEMPSAPL